MEKTNRVNRTNVKVVVLSGLSFLLALCAWSYFTGFALASHNADSSGWASRMNNPVSAVMTLRDLDKGVVIQKGDIKEKTVRFVERGGDAPGEVDEVVGRTTLESISKGSILRYSQLSVKPTSPAKADTTPAKAETPPATTEKKDK
ncbi:MAG TPA: SAF domain-containing protein [Planktothrix sp.]|jgi:hypothetical protein